MEKGRTKSKTDAAEAEVSALKGKEAEFKQLVIEDEKQENNSKEIRVDGEVRLKFVKKE